VPSVVVGHSAGAAVAARLCLDGRAKPRVVVSFNGALRAFRGLAQQFYAPLAKLLVLNPFVPRFVAPRRRQQGHRRAADSPDRVDNRRARASISTPVLLGNPGHVAGTLGMMAGWNLPALERDLPRLATKLVLVACSDDGAVPATDAFAVQEVVPDAEVVFLRHLGHLMHEEKPAMATDIVPQSRRDTRPINTCEKCPVKFTVVSVSLE
jgi:magnesium chelatase accessory protein